MNVQSSFNTLTSVGPRSSGTEKLSAVLVGLALLHGTRHRIGPITTYIQREREIVQCLACNHNCTTPICICTVRYTVHSSFHTQADQSTVVHLFLTEATLWSQYRRTQDQPGEGTRQLWAFMFIHVCVHTYTHNKGQGL